MLWNAETFLCDQLSVDDRVPSCHGVTTLHDGVTRMCNCDSPLRDAIYYD